MLCMHGCVAPEQCVLSDNEVITWFIYGLHLDHLQMPLDLAAALSTELSLHIPRMVCVWIFCAVHFHWILVSLNNVFGCNLSF